MVCNCRCSDSARCLRSFRSLYNVLFPAATLAGTGIRCNFIYNLPLPNLPGIYQRDLRWISLISRLISAATAVYAAPLKRPSFFFTLAHFFVLRRDVPLDPSEQCKTPTLYIGTGEFEEDEGKRRIKKLLASQDQQCSRNGAIPLSADRMPSVCRPAYRSERPPIIRVDHRRSTRCDSVAWTLRTILFNRNSKRIIRPY